MLTTVSLPERVVMLGLNDKGPNAQTVLSLATQKGLVSTVGLLLDKAFDIDPNIADKDGRTAFWHACHSGNQTMVILFLNHAGPLSTQVNIDAVDGLGRKGDHADVCPDPACISSIQAKRLILDAQPEQYRLHDLSRIDYPPKLVSGDPAVQEEVRLHPAFLGRGAGGTVFRGTFTDDSGRKLPVAVKVVSESPLEPGEAITFEREVTVWEVRQKSHG